MQLNPSYGPEPLVSLSGDPSAIAGPANRQRQRLADTLAELDEQQWQQQSRCSEWTSRDVISHLAGTNDFWTMSIQAGIAGEPTEILAAFDPVVTPAQLVEAGPQTSEEVLAAFSASATRLNDLLISLTSDDWNALAEAPPGHISVSALVHHALWDSWIHERDVLLPLGIPAIEEDDEVLASLRYVVGLSPSLALTQLGDDEAPSGAVQINTTNPEATLLVRVNGRVTVTDDGEDGVPSISGDAVEMLETLSFRRPWDITVSADVSWMFGGLTRAFDLD